MSLGLGEGADVLVAVGLEARKLVCVLVEEEYVEEGRRACHEDDGIPDHEGDGLITTAGTCLLEDGIEGPVVHKRE